MVHRLKTDCQWSFLFVDIECCKPPFSWQTVYYYYRKWSEKGVFKEMFETYLEIQKDKLDTEKLNLDGTHSLVKKSAESVAYQHRKRGRTSNILIMTDGKGIPIANGGIISGNHNDLYQIVPQYAQMIKDLKSCGICVDNSIQNADKGFDSKKLRRAIRRRKYRVAFVVDETFSTISNEEIPNVFQLIIDKASDELEPYDPKVSRTIEDM